MKTLTQAQLLKQRIRTLRQRMLHEHSSNIRADYKQHIAFLSSQI